MKSILTTISATTAALGLMATSAMALQVNWSMETTEALYADGSIIPTDGLTFSIGTFTDGFSPLGAAFEDVSANWLTAGLDGNTATWTNLAQPGFESFGRLGDTGTIGTVVRPDGPIGSQGYMFGYTSLDVGTAPQWLLLTNADWTFPVGTPAGEVALPGADWSATDAGTQMIFGSSFNLVDAGSALERSFQTQAIPEPSTYALIFGLGILGFLGYRRTRK